MYTPVFLPMTVPSGVQPSGNGLNPMIVVNHQNKKDNEIIKEVVNM